MKLEDKLRQTIRLKHYSHKTEENYVGWYRRFVLWHGKRHPAEIGRGDRLPEGSPKGKGAVGR